MNNSHEIKKIKTCIEIILDEDAEETYKKTAFLELLFIFDTKGKDHLKNKIFSIFKDEGWKEHLNLIINEVEKTSTEMRQNRQPC